ncbi:MAG: acetyl-CoA carboxylase carboxyltransferase subunit beta [Planctomycetes bacterium]|nr:acetyl-CoA carboxylase carboxyltransferase subunit beta [Planctomycetota bacterium]
MSWTNWRKKLSLRTKKEVPDGLFLTCEGCQKMIYKKHKEEGMEVCPECDYHFYLPIQKRLEMLLDPGSFEERFADIGPTDPLRFVDREPYETRLKKVQAQTGTKDAILVGIGSIQGRKAALGLMDFRFMGGSMGSVVGEKITRITECALERLMPLVILSASGGARMQEGALSLMQMAKTSCALARLSEAGILYVSVLTNPTTAGVLASFAGLGDIIIAEPKALIGFTGPRVIKETIKQDLPPGFQRSEFLLEHGLIDMIVHRRDLRERLGQVLQFCPERPASPGREEDPSGRHEALPLWQRAGETAHASATVPPQVVK